MRNRVLSLGALFGLALGIALGAPAPSSARTWCANPIYVHEWGVVAFGPTGAERSMPTLPPHFHRAPASGGASAPPVRHLPPDGGERLLPVVQFYTAGRSWLVPLGFEVGFRQGDASRWFPQVDGYRSSTNANSAAAHAGRAQLLRDRAARPLGRGGPPLGRDPTRQLAWDRLELRLAPTNPPPSSSIPWVRALRSMPSALWVNRGGETERFLFYEGRTREQPAIDITRGPSYTATRHHYVLRNRSRYSVRDVIFLHRAAGREYVFYAPLIPAGRTTGFVMEDHGRASGRPSAEARLRTALVDSAQPRVPTRYSWGSGGCVMMRDPAIPTERSGGHRLYTAEVDALLHAWGAQFFGRGRSSHTAILYREDNAYLDATMPISVYTNMRYFVDLRRASLALIQNVALP